MALKVGDRIRQNTLSTGVGGVSLVGDIPGFQRFSEVLSSGDLTYYVIEENDKFEVGVGVYGSDNIERFHVLSSSNNGSKIELGGSGAVFITYPSDKSVIRDLESQVVVGASGLIFNNGTVVKEARVVELTDVNLEGSPSNQYLIDFNTTNKSLVIGESAGPSNSRNTLIGHGAGSGITSGSSNTNIGTDAGHKNEQGFKNVSVGDLSGPSDQDASISVSRTVNVGYQAGEKSRDDSVNIGYQAGAAAYSRGHVSIGSFSGSGIGSYSFVGGYEAAQSHEDDYLVAIGYRSAKNGGGESAIWIGKQAGQDTSSAINSIGMGELSGQGSSGNHSIYLGKKSGKDNSTNDMLFVSNNSPSSEGTLIKGSFSSKRLAVGKSDVALSDAFYVGVNSATDNGIVVQGASLQSSDLTQWRAFDGESVASVSNSGTILANGISASGQGVRLDSSTPIITDSTLYNVEGSLYWGSNSISDQVSYASGQAIINEGDISYVSGVAVYASGNVYDDTYISGVAVYSSGQAIINEGDISYVSGIAVYASGEYHDYGYISGVAAYSSGVLVDGGTLIPSVDKGIALAKGANNFPMTITQEDNSSGGAYYIRLRDNDTDNIVFGATDADAFQITASGEGSSDAENIFKFSSTANDDRLVFGGSTVPTRVLGSNINLDGPLYLDSPNASFLFHLSYNGSEKFRFNYAQFYSSIAGGGAALGRSDKYWGSFYSRNAYLKGHVATNVPLTIDAQAAQSANLTEWKASDGVVVAQVEPDGSISTSGNVNVSGVVTTPNVKGTTNLYLQNDTDACSISLAGSAITLSAYSTIYQQFTTLGVGYRKACYPIFNGTLDLGSDTNRWGATYSEDGDFSKTVSASGIQASGALLHSHTPTDTANKLYNNGGTLMFNGSSVDSGQVSGSASGVAFFGDDGLLTDDSSFVFNSGNKELELSSITAHKTQSCDLDNTGNTFQVDLASDNAWLNNQYANKFISKIIGDGASNQITNISSALEFRDSAHTGTSFWGTNSKVSFYAPVSMASWNRVIGLEGGFSNAHFCSFLGTHLIGVRAYNTFNYNPTVNSSTKFVGFKSEVSGASVSGVADYRHFWATDTNFVEVGNSYGMYIEEQTKGATGNYSIYTAGGLSEFNGRVSVVGDSSTQVPFAVNSSVSQSANLTEWKASDGVVVAQVAPDGSIASSGDISSSGDVTAAGLNSESLKVFNVGYDGATDSEYLDISTGGLYTIQPKKTGSTSTRSLYIKSGAGGQGEIALKSNGTGYLTWGGVNNLIWDDGVTKIDSNLITETGRSLKMYNLGSNGSTDSEYLETSWDTNVAKISTQATGTGASRILALGKGGVKSNIDIADTYITLEVKYGQNIVVADGYTAVYQNFWPAVDGTIELGLSNRRWSDVYSVDGDFSGSVSGARGFFESSTTTDSALTITSAVSQTANLQEWRASDDVVIAQVSPDGSISTSGDVNVSGSVALNEGVTITGDLINSAGSTLTVRNNGAAALNVGSSSRITAYYHVVPDNTGTKSLGLANRRWSEAFGVDGSFTGDLNVENSGSFKLFNLGDSHTSTTNTEYLETVVDTNTYCIRTGATGTGTTIRNIYIGTGFGGSNTRGVIIKNSEAEFNFGGPRFKIAGGQHTTWAKILPVIDGAYALGEDGKRWSNVASVDGNFSGSVSGARGFFESSTTTDSALTITSAVSQTANLTEWKNSSDETLTKVTSDGSVHVSGNIVSEQVGEIRNYILGKPGDTNTEYLQIGDLSKTVYNIQPKKTGSGQNRHIRIASADGRGKLNLYSDGHLNYSFYNTLTFSAFHWGISVSGEIRSTGDEQASLGQSTSPFANVYSTDGSFAGDLNVEPSGSLKVYDLGDSHTNTTDTRYLDFSFDGSSYSYPTISQQVTGTGTLAYVLALKNGDGNLQIKTNGGFNFKDGVSDLLIVTAGAISAYRNTRPANNGYLDLGANTLRWKNTYSVNGDFSGSVSGARGFFESSTTTDSALTITSAVSQTANLQEWRASDDVVIAQVEPDGSIATSGDVSVSGDLVANQFLKFYGGNGPSIYSTGSHAYLRNSLGQSRLRWGSDGGIMVFGSITPNSANAYDIGENGNRTYRNLYLGTSVHSSGVQTSGVLLHSHVPTDTTSQLYNDGGALMFNGSAVGGGGGSVTGTPSGVAFFGDDGSLTDSTEFVAISGNYGRFVGVNSDGAPDRTLVVGSKKYLSTAGFKLVNYAKGNALLEIVATSGGRTAGMKFSNGTNDWWSGPLQNSLGGLGTRHVIASYELDNTKSMVYDTNGSVVIGGTSPNARLHVNTLNSSSVNSIFQATSAQSANITEWRASDGVTIASVSPDGSIASSGNISASGTVTAVDGDFSGRVLTDRLENVAGYSYFRVGAGTAGVIRSWRNFEPQLNNGFNLGGSTLRWANTYGVNADFTGTVNVSGDLTVNSGVTITNDATSSDKVLLRLETSTGAELLAFKNSNSNTTPVPLVTYPGGYFSMYNGFQVRKNTATGMAFYVTNNSSHTKWRVNAEGSMVFGGSSSLYSVNPRGMLDIYCNSSTSKGIIVQGAAAQSENLTQWQASDEVVVASVASDGSIASSGNISASGDATIGGVIYTDYIRNTSGNDIIIGGQASNNIKINGSVAGSNTARMTSRGNTFTITAEDNFGNNLGHLILNGEGGTYLQYDGSTKLSTTTTGVSVDGHFTATSKSFLIDHPTKKDAKLQYASLEGPEHGVYVRGSVTENVIELPDHWLGLVDEDSITVQLTAKGHPQPNMLVRSIVNNKVYISSDVDIDAFYNVYAERKDIDKLEVEIWQ